MNHRLREYAGCLVICNRHKQRRKEKRLWKTGRTGGRRTHLLLEDEAGKEGSTCLQGSSLQSLLCSNSFDSYTFVQLMES